MSLEIGRFDQAPGGQRVIAAIVPGGRIHIVEDEMFVVMDVEAAVVKAATRLLASPAPPGVP